MSHNLQSPNAIPPRTSSASLNSVANHGYASPQKPVLKPLAEESWLGQSKTSSSSLTPTSPTKSHRRGESLPLTMSPRAPAPQKDIGYDQIYMKRPAWSADQERILSAPFKYLDEHPGKNIRSQLIHAFNKWLKVPEGSLEVIKKVVGMLHTASLLYVNPTLKGAAVDDVEDSSVLRRGVPVAHNIFGTAQTINSANYIYFRALQELRKLRSLEAIDMFTEELLNLHRGQGMDLYWRDTLTCPSEDDYLEMVGNKTGGLFRLAIKLMQTESQSSVDCVPLVNTIGMLFQILDDYNNLHHPVYTANKGNCEDLTEGKFSFPIIHAIRADTSNMVLMNILKQKTKDDEVKKYAVQYMDRMGSFEYTRSVLRGLEGKAKGLVDQADAGSGDGDTIRKILEKLRPEG
ncbi:MAG: geranylgeranyl pyrophosphate synthetase [Bogoriella megaspora]|nr:MAG: geranylgeranyl pyrophosphate synthetase [Bogoriella megaspora]